VNAGSARENLEAPGWGLEIVEPPYFRAVFVSLSPRKRLLPGRQTGNQEGASGCVLTAV